MNEQLKEIPTNMKELGLGALRHANRHAAYDSPENDKWAELSVLQAAHAAEILIKARIAEEHPLLLFESFPAVTEDELSSEALFTEGHTIEWSKLYSILWATTNIKIPSKATFTDFGKLRNGIQHFGVKPKDISASLKTLQFIYKIIDPFINECWGLYAIDFDEDYASYENLLPVLIRYEISFLVSPDAAACHELWEEELQECSDAYQYLMKKRIEHAVKKLAEA